MDDQRLSIQAALTAKADHNVINEAIEQIRIEVGRRPIRILDVGCGTGEVTCSRFQHLDQIDVTAIDASKEAIEIARQRCTSKKIRFQASVLDQVPANRFDLIFCSYSAHHNASSFLQEVWSRLRPDGTLLVRTCNDRLFTCDSPQDYLKRLRHFSGQLPTVSRRHHGDEMPVEASWLAPTPKSIEVHYSPLSSEGAAGNDRMRFFDFLCSSHLGYLKSVLAAGALPNDQVLLAQQLIDEYPLARDLFISEGSGWRHMLQVWVLVRPPMDTDALKT